MVESKYRAIATKDKVVQLMHKIGWLLCQPKIWSDRGVDYIVSKLTLIQCSVMYTWVYNCTPGWTFRTIDIKVNLLVTLVI